MVDLGPQWNDPVWLEEAAPLRDGTGGTGVVVAVDRFGNLLTNLPGEWTAPGRARLEVSGESVLVEPTYAAVAPGDLLALIGSDGRLEIAVRDGSAATRLRAERGTPVRLRSG
jgi:S-adenosylmethionine hydrolase